MERFLAVFSSLNQVTLIKRRLYREAVYVEMMRTPQCLASTGCAFALRCDAGQLELVRRTSESLGIPVDGVFQETNTGGKLTYLREGNEPCPA